MNQMEKQRAFEYSIYIMLSSYFDKPNCNTQLQEKKLCLAYQELKENVKQNYDERSIHIIEKELLPKLPKNFMNQQFDFTLVGREDNPFTEIRLQNEDYMLRLKSKYAKNAPKMVYEIWQKKAA